MPTFLDKLINDLGDQMSDNNEKNLTFSFPAIVVQTVQLSMYNVCIFMPRTTIV